MHPGKASNALRIDHRHLAHLLLGQETSALGLQRVLGLKNYRTAWSWLHKLRRAMVRPGRDRLAGTVEVDETYLGGLEEGLRGRQVEMKALIVIAAQEDGQGIGRIRLRHIADASAASLIPDFRCELYF